MNKLLVQIFAIILLCSFKQDKIRLLFDEKITVINSDTIYLDMVRTLKIDRLESLFGENTKRIKQRKNGTVLYHFKNKGISAVTTINNSKMPFQLEIDFQENENLERKVKMFDGDLEFFGKKIDKNSCFKELYYDSKIHSMIDYSFYGATDTANIKANYFYIITKNGQYFLHFKGMGGDSKIDFMTATL